MAETAQEKTEKPTHRRLTKARQEGNVPSSQEMMSAVSLTVLTITTALMGPAFVTWAMDQMKEAFSLEQSPFVDANTFLGFVNSKMISCLLIAAPFFLILMAAGIASNIMISGFNFTFKPLVWKLDSLNPVAGFKRLFGLSSLVKLLLSIVKIAFISIIVYFYIRKKLPELAAFQWAWSSQILAVISMLILGVLIRICIGIFIIAAADLIYQKWRYIDKLKMTKQEVKEERKNQEGPPEVKRRIRQKQFEIAMRRMLQEVPKANVVLVNPTHVAVALKYDPDKMLAPIVVAKGGDNICEKIKEVARAYGVPIIRRPALARSIFSAVDLNQPIPDSLFVAVAEVLALVYRLRRKR